MKPAQEAKSEVINQVKDKFAKAKTTVMVDYRGLTVAQVSDLRRKLREVGGEMVVVKNTLTLKSLEKKVAEGLAGILAGPTALVFSGDEISVPKALSAFSKTVGLPQIKGGLADDRVLTAEEVKALASIPGKDVLQGRLVGILAGQPTRLVWALSGNLTKLVRVLAETQRVKSN